MKYILIAFLAVIFLIVIISYICFRLAFYVSRRPKKDVDEFAIPDGEIYEPYRDTMVGWMKEVRQLPHQEFSIVSHDGLKLYGKYYEYKKGAPIELMFHGYRGSAERDLCGGVQRCFSLERNVLIVDQRTSGKSEGNVITFGIKESKDCLLWIDFLISQFGKDVKIILTGISMGASTVMIASGYDLPENVIGVLADCGFSDAKKIIKKVIKQLKLPADILYPFVRLGALLFGHFNLEETSAIKAMGKCKVPVIFFHGEQDDFVPCSMSKECFNACKSRKQLVTVKGAGHGLSYLIDPDGYIDSLKVFFK